MGSFSKVSLFALLLLLSTGGAAFGDALCNYDDTVKLDAHLKKGKEAERKGKALEALLFFKAADQFCGPRPEARAGTRRIGAQMGAAAAAKGRLFTGKKIFSLAQDENCRKWARHTHVTPNPYEPGVPGLCTDSYGGMRVEFDSSAGAYEWFEATLNYTESDSLVLKAAASSPGDLGAYDAAYRHFKARALLNEHDYSPDPAHLSALKKIAASSLTSLLSREEKEYAGHEGTDISLTLLDSAIRWTSYTGGPDRARVIQRAIERAEGALKGAAIHDLHDALEFYSFAGAADRIQDVAKRAEELGLSALENNDPVTALRFFMLSGNRDLIKKTKPLAEKGQKGV